jgi:hypothetical protein
LKLLDPGTHFRGYFKPVAELFSSDPNVVQIIVGANPLKNHLRLLVRGVPQSSFADGGGDVPAIAFFAHQDHFRCVARTRELTHFVLTSGEFFAADPRIIRQIHNNFVVGPGPVPMRGAASTAPRESILNIYKNS